MKKIKKKFLFVDRNNEYSTGSERKFKKLEDKMKKYSIVILVILTLFTFTDLRAAIALNDLACVFSEAEEKVLVEDNVVAGATEFLLSKSYSDLILMEYEKSERQTFNFSLVLDYVDKAISALESSKEKYMKAKDVGEKLGYIEKKISWFENFNYDEFIYVNKLNKDIADIVKIFLSKCDIIGLYQQNIDNIDGILKTLESIKEKVKANIKPDTSIMWKLLQQYSETLLIGNYSTIIGSEILAICAD